MLTQTPNRPTFSGIKHLLYETKTSEVYVIVNRTALESLHQMSLF